MPDRILPRFLKLFYTFPIVLAIMLILEQQHFLMEGFKTASNPQVHWFKSLKKFGTTHFRVMKKEAKVDERSNLIR